MMLKMSKYNIFNINTQGICYIFNVFTRECELLSSRLYELLRKGDIDAISKNVDLLKILMDKGFILDSNIDETELIDFKFNVEAYANDILDITLVMTHTCNFECVYCYQCSEKNDLTDETEKRVIEFIDKKTKRNLKKLYINWFGGEPLLKEKKILDMSKAIIELSKKNKFSYIGRMTTNGYLLDAHTIEKLVKLHICIFMITLDGTKEYHDKQRPLKSGGGSYDTIIENLENIKKINRHFTIDIRVNVSNDNCKNIEKFLDEFSIRFGDDSRFNLVFEAVHDWKGERVPQHMELVVSDSQVVKEIYTLASRKGVNIQNYFKYAAETQICPAIKKNGYVIAGDGKVYKCEMAMNDEIYSEESHIGYLAENGSLISNPYKEAKWLTRNRNLEKCYECVAYPYCMGGAQCNYGMKFHHQMRCNDNIEYVYWTSELYSKTKENMLC